MLDQPNRRNIRRGFASLLAAALFAGALGGCFRREPEPIPEPEMESEPETPPGPKINKADRGQWGRPREPEEPDTTLRDFTAQVREKQELNPESVGWLYVPQCDIDNVSMHGPDRVFDHFAKVNFDGVEDGVGAFFADYRAEFGKGSRGDLRALTTLYGHSFWEDPDSGLFSGLKRYKDPEFARENPYLYFSTWEENMAFEIVAVFEAHADLPYIRYNISREDFAAMLDAVWESSYYDYGAEVAETDRLLVLSTCAMTVQGHDNLDPYATDYRFVVMAKLVPPGKAVKERAALTVNENPAAPDRFRNWWMYR